MRNNNLVLSRETLLTQVWEAHDQVASGNNLNNTISILRKAFSSLGEVDLGRLKSLLEQKNIPCNVPATVLYYDSKSVAPNTLGLVRASYFYYCPQAEMATGKVQCENYYEHWAQ
ncbi:hypothetical protein BHU62_21420 [Serratia marcescens]|uniref:OmpR/PhoB-type domain-containing protein n=1 Tax=Serratia marcescens TaxID=615 RepID=A0A1Q4NUX4_SERMA|nr:hypothetical protein [Serratia marcescens]OKB64700.1 hypothetical protein BHU62_21420 [Serratia marcescens]